MTNDRRTAAAKIRVPWRRLCGGAAAGFCVLGAIGFVHLAGERIAWAQGPVCAPTQIIGPVGEGLDELARDADGTVWIKVTACAPGEAIVVFGGGTPGLVRVHRQTSQNPPRYEGEAIFNPCTLGGSDAPGSPVTVRFVSVEANAHTLKALKLSEDKDKPTVKLTTNVPNGRLVWPGVQIVARADARDDYTDGRVNWQGGVQIVEISDESGGQSRALSSARRSGPPPPCNPAAKSGSITVTYPVPANPPRTIRLVARAWDFNNQPAEEDVAEFPVARWYGRIKQDIHSPGHRHTTIVRFAFNVDSAGQLKGIARAEITSAPDTVGPCTFLYKPTPDDFEVAVSGRRSGNDFEIALSTEVPTTVTTTISGCRNFEDTKPYPASALRLGGSPSELNPAWSPDTIVFRVPAQDGAADTVPLRLPPPAPGSYRYHYEIHRTP